MNITSAQYIKSLHSDNPDTIAVVIDGENMSVPMDEQNRHYAEILRQVKEEGLTIKDAE
jgi:hypothetical protein